MSTRRGKRLPVKIRHAQLPVIGWREWLAIPSLGIDRIKAKIDTGARTSAIHAFDIRSHTENGTPHVSFAVHPQQRRRKPAIRCSAEIIDERQVTSSNGEREWRFVIAADIVAGGLVWPIELTLTDRDAMGFRMLLGREAIRGRFLVDTGGSFLLGSGRASGAPTTEAKGSLS